MNDSFLEDLEIVSVERKVGSTVHHAERHITRRRSQHSPPQASSEQDELNYLMAKQKTRQKIAPSNVEPKILHRRSADSFDAAKEERKPGGREIQMESVRSRATEQRTRPAEVKLKPVENTENAEKPKSKIDRKDRPRWSAGSTKESSRCSDGSSKENSRPSDSSKDSPTQAETVKERVRSCGDGSARKREADEKFEIAMLNSVKEIVSTYTKSESTKILRAMQEFYISSQSNLIKLMLQQTDDVSTVAGKDSPRLRLLASENERLRENIAFLEARNEELRKTVDEYEQIKQENLQLKNRCKELLGCGTAKQIKSCSHGSSKENSRPSSLSKDSASPKTRARQFMELCRNPK